MCLIQIVHWLKKYFTKCPLSPVVRNIIDKWRSIVFYFLLCFCFVIVDEYSFNKVDILTKDFSFTALFNKGAQNTI